MALRRGVFVLLLGALATSCSTTTPTPSASTRPSPAAIAGQGIQATPTAVPTSPAASSSASASPDAAAGVYAWVADGVVSPAIASLPPRVYVPDENSGDVVVIDPTTFRVIGRFNVGLHPEHITPDWDLSRLYVNNMSSSSLTVIDPVTERPSGTIPVPFPYNLYFSVDGRTAIVVDDFLGAGAVSRNGLRFYDRKTWRLVKWLQIPWTGADHLDFSADGSFLLVSCETSGVAVKVDMSSMKIAGVAIVGGLPLDVRLAPSGRVFYVANQGLSGVSVVNAATLHVDAFIHTGLGAHGLGLSRDARTLYVTNRLAGTISVIDVGTNRVTATWRVGGSPDMIAFSTDGSQMWVSNRYNGTVEVIDPSSGQILHTIATGANPHGLAYWPEPGRYSLGHNGDMR